MFCMHCGQLLQPDTAFCPNCGKKVETPSSPPTPLVTPVSEQTNGADSGASEKIESYLNYALVITALAFFQCGTYINLVLGIVAILFANKVEQNLKSGDIKQAKENAKTAKTLCMIATGVIVVQIIAVFFVIAIMTLFYAIPFLILLFQ